MIISSNKGRHTHTDIYHNTGNSSQSAHKFLCINLLYYKKERIFINYDIVKIIPK